MPDEAENDFLVEISLKSTLNVPLNTKRMGFGVIDGKLLPEAKWSGSLMLFRNNLQGISVSFGFYLLPSSED